MRVRDAEAGRDRHRRGHRRFLRDTIARFKVPRHVVFGPLPKTSTGKIQKFVLRERAKETG